jgi:hypothetical protein
VHVFRVMLQGAPHEHFVPGQELLQQPPPLEVCADSGSGTLFKQPSYAADSRSFRIQAAHCMDTTACTAVADVLRHT